MTFPQIITISIICSRNWIWADVPAGDGHGRVLFRQEEGSGDWDRVLRVWNRDVPVRTPCRVPPPGIQLERHHLDHVRPGSERHHLQHVVPPLRISPGESMH